MNGITTPPEARLITGEELMAMGDIGPRELIDGRIVPMVPTGDKHGIVEFSLGRHLGNFVTDRKLGWVMGGKVGIYTHWSPDRVREADVVFISVEIIPPEDRWHDVWQKLEEYFAIGVQWVWILEPENCTVLVYRSVTEMQRSGEGDLLVGEGVLEGSTLPISSLFAG